MEITARVTEHPKHGPTLAGATAAEAYSYLQGEEGYALRTWDDAEYLLDEWIRDNAIFEGNGEDEGADLYYEWRDAALRWIDAKQAAPAVLDPQLIPISSHDYSAPPVWEPLEAIAPAGFNLAVAMYMGTAELDTGAVVRIYKNADTRRTIYVAPEIIGRWQDTGADNDGALLPFHSLNAALTYWTS
jgi:hypothetical protein